MQWTLNKTGQKKLTIMCVEDAKVEIVTVIQTHRVNTETLETNRVLF